VTGWPTVLSNGGVEGLWLTSNAGSTWTDISGNLVSVTGTVGKARPSGLLFIPVPSKQNTAILVGTTRGIYYTWLNGSNNKWNRLGSCSEFPAVLTMDLSYTPEDDTLVIATMGRGIYTVTSISKLLGFC